MGTEITGQSPFQGIVVVDERFDFAALDSSNSNYDQAGPRPGVPVPAAGQASDLALEAHGAQTSSSFDVEISEGGLPDDRAALLWKLSTASDWNGWNGPNFAGDVRRLAAAGTRTRLDAAAGVTLPDGDVVVVANAGGYLSDYVLHYTDSGGWVVADGVLAADFTSATERDTSTLTGMSAFASWGVGPAPFVTPAGELFVLAPVIFDGGLQFHLVSPGDASDLTGTAWKIRSRFVLPDELAANSTTAHTSARVEYVGDTVVLVIGYTDGSSNKRLLQYASSDEGCSFVLLDDWADSSLTAQSPDLVTLRSGVCVLAYGNPADSTISIRWIANAFEAFSSQPAVAVTGAFPGVPVEVGITADTDGLRPVIYSGGEGADRATPYFARSRNPSDWVDNTDFRSWNPGLLNLNYGGNIRFGGRFIPRLGTDEQHGSVVFVRAYDAFVAVGALVNTSINGTEPDFSCVFCGGYSNLTMPEVEAGYNKRTRLGFGYISVGGGQSTAWPSDDVNPPGFGYTLLNTAATLTKGTVYQSWGWDGSSSPVRGYYRDNPAGTVADGATVMFALRVQSGGSLSSSAVSVMLRTADGSTDYEVEVRFTTSGCRLVDNNGSGTDDGVAILTGWSWFILQIQGGKAVLYRRGYDSTSWKLLCNLSGLTSPAGPSGSNRVEWGQRSSSSAVSDWAAVDYIFESGTDNLRLVDQPANPDDLAGRPLSTEGVYLSGGLKVRGVDGPARRGESWTIPPRFDYPVEALFPPNNPSTSTEWLSTDTTEQRIAFDLGHQTVIGWPFAVYVVGANFREAYFEGYNGAGWDVLATLDGDVGLDALDFERDGDVVTVPRTGSSANIGGRFVNRAELVGGYWRDATGNVRRIVHNTGGAWRRGSSSHQPRLRLADVTGAEDVSGTCAVWPSSHGAIVHDVTTSYQLYRFRIPSQTTAEGYFKAAKLIIGPVAVLGWKWSRGKIDELAPRTALSEDRAGRRRAERLSAARRTASVVWAEGVDHSDVMAVDPDPAFIRSDPTDPASEPIASRSDVAGLLEGILEETDGPRALVVAIPNLPAKTSSASVFAVNDRRAWLYGRITSSARREQIQAVKQTDGVDEVLRIAQIVVSEEL